MSKVIHKHREAKEEEEDEEEKAEPRDKRSKEAAKNNLTLTLASVREQYQQQPKAVVAVAWITVALEVNRFSVSKKYKCCTRHIIFQKV